ncbi:MAG: T9SS type A sorting domain-containing protein, partial [Salegentibacter sp.]
PNPVTGGKVYISTKKNLEKEIEIYNVLGKPVFKTRLRGRELDISSLTAGIYILKIKEGDEKATRKLVVR